MGYRLLELEMHGRSSNSPGLDGPRGAALASRPIVVFRLGRSALSGGSNRDSSRRSMIAQRPARRPRRAAVCSRCKPHAACGAASSRLPRMLNSQFCRRRENSAGRAGAQQGVRRECCAGPTPARPASFRNHGSVRQRNPARQPRRGDAALLPRLRDERDRRAGAAGRARRAQAGAPPRALRHARGEQRLEPALREVRARGRRRAREVPPARRLGHLRSAGAHGAGLLACATR